MADKRDASRQTINTIETEKQNSSLSLALESPKQFKKSIEEIFEMNED